MLQSRFDALRERLLRAGIAPRHVRRYIDELRDHLDDLVREERASGSTLGVAEVKARARLGNDDDLASVMISRPDLRSLAARYPWAVFGLSPVAMVLLALVCCLVLEIGLISAAGTLFRHPTANEREWFVFAVAIWNTLWTYAAPLAIAAGLCVLGLRQRMPAAWILFGVALACFFGAFQEIHFSDDGRHGELSIGSGLVPPFPVKLIVGGLYRLAITATLAGALYWFARRNTAQIEQSKPLPAE